MNGSLGSRGSRLPEQRLPNISLYFQVDYTTYKYIIGILDHVASEWWEKSSYFVYSLDFGHEEHCKPTSRLIYLQGKLTHLISVAGNNYLFKTRIKDVLGSHV